MKQRRIGTLILKLIAFALGLLVLLCYTGNVLQPIWRDWNNFDTLYGFYEEPENTIETVFFGSSYVVGGVAPAELYADYGICAYNIGTQQQPTMASYYWLEEIHRLHSESLKTVFLEVSMLRKTPDISAYRQAIDPMRLSSIKYRAVRDYSDSTAEALIYLFPSFAYHDRWSSLTTEDFQKSSLEKRTYLRGYQYYSLTLVQGMSYQQIPALSLPRLVDTEVPPAELHSESLDYVEKMAAFCRENGLQLVLFRTPNITEWTSADHNAVQAVADTYDLEFLDFCFSPLLEEISFHPAADTMDLASHLNHTGASKLTHWIGNYLTRHCNATDVRGNAKYAHLEAQWADYSHLVLEPEQLASHIDPVQYLQDAAEHTDYTVFITVKDEASAALTDAQRAAFADMGLSELAQLGSQDSYLAVLQQGQLLYEARLTAQSTSGEPLTFASTLPDGSPYTLTSGGYHHGDIASCCIQDQEQAENMRGINIVVYDNTCQKVLHSAAFDTHLASVSCSKDYETSLAQCEYEKYSPEVRQIFLYDLNCKRAAQLESLASASLAEYVSTFGAEEDVSLFVTSYGDASYVLSAREQQALAAAGLKKLTGLTAKDAYIAAIHSGQVLHEQKSASALQLSYDAFDYTVYGGNFSSVCIDGIHYPAEQPGLQLVIYDHTLGRTLLQITFPAPAAANL